MCVGYQLSKSGHRSMPFGLICNRGEFLRGNSSCVGSTIATTLPFAGPSGFETPVRDDDLSIVHSRRTNLTRRRFADTGHEFWTDQKPRARVDGKTSTPEFGRQQTSIQYQSAHSSAGFGFHADSSSPLRLESLSAFGWIGPEPYRFRHKIIWGWHRLVGWYYPESSVQFAQVFRQSRMFRLQLNRRLEDQIINDRHLCWKTWTTALIFR